ncbi:MAG: hypothetical protein ABI175_30090 [Polyangiales bacterium]
MSGRVEVPGISEPGFAAEVRFDDPATLELRGNADIAASGTLGALIGRLHEELVAHGAREVIVDMVQLEFMNASAFNEIVSWLELVQELPPGRRYHMRFRSSDKILWQRRSLRTLSCFATDLIEIET